MLNQIYKIKFYQKGWFIISLGVLILILLISLYITSKDNYILHNWNELAKTTIKKQKIEIDSLTKKYEKVLLQKEKIKVIREKITITKEKSLVEQIDKEIEKLKQKPPTVIKDITPEELNEYFKQLL